MMEVPGRRPKHAQNAKPIGIIENFCQPCSKRGKHFATIKYCQNCNANLCRSCSDYHRTLQLLQNHKLVDVTDESPHLHNIHASIPTIPCHKHPEEIVKFFCRIDNVTSCSVCAVLDHSGCKLEYIPDISVAFKGSKEYRSLKDNVDNLEKNIADILQLSQKNKEKEIENGQRAIDQIRQFREKINSNLKERENVLVAQVQKLQDKNLQFLQAEEVKCGAVKSDLREMKSKLAKLDTEYSDLFIECNEMLNRVKEIMKVVDRTRAGNVYHTYTVVENKMYTDLLSLNTSCSLNGIIRLDTCVHSSDAATTIRKNNPKKIATASELNWSECVALRQQDIDIGRLNNGSGDNWISGQTFIQPKTLLLADFYQKCIWNFNSETRILKGRLELASAPWDITSLGQDQSAITLPEEEKILITSTKNVRLPALRSFRVNGVCYGIDTTSDKRLVVSYNSPSKVEVMNENGIVQYLVSENNGIRLFSSPEYVNVVMENGKDMIYLSDSATGQISKLPINRKHLLTTYKLISCEDLKAILSVDDDYFLACSSILDTAFLVSKRGEYFRPLFRNEDESICPCSMSYNQKEKILYVGSYGCSTLKVFKIC